MCGGIGIINYRTLGAGKDILFLHGWGGCIDSFIGVANFFCKNYRCTLVDFAGFGKTPLTKVMSLLD
ncbi:MAG: alpha/beta hydrolase, partial [Clostridia bacterium]